MALVYRDFNLVTVVNDNQLAELFRFDFTEYQNLSAGALLGPNKAARITIAGDVSQQMDNTTHAVSFFITPSFELIVTVPEEGVFQYKISVTLAADGTGKLKLLGELSLGQAYSGIFNCLVGEDDASLLSESLVINVLMDTADADFSVTKQVALVEYL